MDQRLTLLPLKINALKTILLAINWLQLPWNLPFHWNNSRQFFRNFHKKRNKLRLSRLSSRFRERASTAENWRLLNSATAKKQLFLVGPKFFFISEMVAGERWVESSDENKKSRNSFWHFNHICLNVWKKLVGSKQTLTEAFSIILKAAGEQLP